jgi:phage terminase large subunit-like protein
MSKLTAKQVRFVEEYLIEPNAAQAALRAGYSAKTARVIWVVDELRKLASSNMADYMKSTPAAADARDVMVEGESGIMGVSPDGARPIYEPSKRRLTWPDGAIATTYSADEPERLRGPQHDCAWCDELGSWRYPEAWDMLMFGLRLGDDPRVIVTTTPRPTRLIKELVADPTVAISRGTTYANRANLAGAFLQQIIRKYEGTRLGRQELNAELLEDVRGALWNRALLEAARPPMGRAAISIKSARPPVITVIGASPVGARLKYHPSRLEMTLPGGYRVNLGPAGGNGRIFVAAAVVLTWTRDGDLKFSQVGARQTASASVFGDGSCFLSDS